MLSQGRRRDRVAILAVAHRKGGVRLRAITTKGVAVQLAAADFDEPPRPVGRIELPTPYTPNRQGFQRQMARMLERAKLDPGPEPVEAGRHAWS